MRRMGDIAPLVRRPVEVEVGQSYREIGVRSFGKGIFHKPPVSGLELGDKRVFRIESGDLVFNIVFAWEGAVALASDAEHGMIGSHRFLTCVVDETLADARFLAWWFSHPAGREQLLWASPGGAGRNRTLGIEKLAALEIPLPPLAEQRRIVARIGAASMKSLELIQHSVSASSAILSLVLSATNERFSSVDSHESLGNVSVVIDPNPSHRYPFYTESGGVPIISSSDFTGYDCIDFSSCKRVADEFYETTLGRYGVSAGDLIFSRKGKIGYARLHPDNIRFAMTHTLCVIQPDRGRIEPRYLLHFARSPEFIAYLNGSMNPNLGVPTLGLNVIREAQIPLPPLPEQRRIVAELDALQAKVAAVKALQAERAAALNALLPAILDRAFRGEL